MAILKLEPQLANSQANFTFGNVTANSFIGDGSQLTGLPASYTNTDVANYLPTFTGNITANNVTANYFIGNGSQLTGLPAGYTDSNVATYLPNYSGAMTFALANIHISGGSSGQYLKTNGSGTLSWGTPAGGGTGGTTVIIDSVAPSAPADGDLWFDTANSQLKIFIDPSWTPVSSVPSMTYVTRKYTADGTGNTYTVTNGCSVNNVLVFVNGLCQAPTDDYTISSTTLTLDGVPANGTKIHIRELPR